jgi:hypothetical protein
MSIYSRSAVLLMAIAGLGASMRAGAATLVFTTTIPSQSYLALEGRTSQVVPAKSIAISEPLTQYDPTAHGPLTSAKIDFSTSFDLSFNNGTDGGGDSYTLGGNLFLGGHGYSGEGGGNGNGGPPGSQFDLPATISDSTTLSDPNDPALQALLGTGTATFLWDEIDDVTVSSFANGNAQFARTGGSVTVTYSFVPEPASLGLLGVAAIALTRRRR